ncbi:hypothetical protein [Diaphorobacter aerolatus]|uniref:Uncharacterized protein n=1 Tax=Diaphorobacter aerolatus TaxID=1288495 RepID=A0A7H0GKV2_9BURK|nr:hypothetical protein [Diaphorobacter aerolatus]QNP48918.1 hypothetical protein H9K75_01570 [Diaphorobacter aerolatus]
MAFVSYEPGGREYPTACLRSDLVVGDSVLIQSTTGTIKRGVIGQLKFLNWWCLSRIYCKVSEAVKSNNGCWELPSSIKISSLLSGDSLAYNLKKMCWIPMRTTHIFRHALTYTNMTLTANILVRTNGIHFQVLPKRNFAQIKPFEQQQEHPLEGRVVEHWLPHTKFNLYEGAIRFAKAIVNNDENLERFFKPVGVNDKRTPQLIKKASESMRRLELSNRAGTSYEDDEASYSFSDYASDMGGGDVYIGDGISYSCGRIVDDGR